MSPPNQSHIPSHLSTADPLVPLEQLLQWLIATTFHLAVGLLIGMLAARLMRRLHLHWSWAAGALALVLLARGALAGEALTLGCAALLAALRGRRWHGDDLQAGADLAVIAAERTTPLDGARAGVRVARRLAAEARSQAARRSSRAWRGDRLCVGVDRHHRPVSIQLGGGAQAATHLSAAGSSVSVSGTHTLVAGATGAGKTYTQAHLATHAIAAGMSAVVIDPKGDDGLCERLRAAALAGGRQLHVWTPEGPSVYNPFAHGSAGEIADRALAGERFTEPHYQRQAQRCLGHAVRALLATHSEVTLAGLAEALHPEALELLARRLPEPAAGKVHAYIDSLTPRQWSELGGVRDRLAILAESDVGRWLDPATPAARFELLDAMRSGAVVYFALDADARPLLAQMLGRAIVQNLQGVVASLQRRPVPCLVAIDEFSAIAAEQVTSLFARARSAGVSLVLGTQELSDLRLPGRQLLLEQVLGNLTTLIAHRQTVPSSAELVARLSGSRGVWRTAVTSDRRTTRTRVAAPTIDAEEVMGLPRGCAAVIRLASPRSAAIAWMHSPD